MAEDSTAKQKQNTIRCSMWTTYAALFRTITDLLYLSVCLSVCEEMQVPGTELNNKVPYGTQCKEQTGIGLEQMRVKRTGRRSTVAE